MIFKHNSKTNLKDLGGNEAKSSLLSLFFNRGKGFVANEGKG